MPVSLTELVGLLSGPAKLCILHNHNIVVGVWRWSLCAYYTKLSVAVFEFADLDADCSLQQWHALKVHFGITHPVACQLWKNDMTEPMRSNANLCRLLVQLPHLLPSA